MYDFFSIYILQYGRWNAYRQAVYLDKEDPRGHITHALYELWVHGPFESISDVKVILRGYEKLEDEDGKILKEMDDEDGTIHDVECDKEIEVTWSDTDFENFVDFKDSFLSNKFKM